MLYVFLDVDGVLNVKTNESCGIKDVRMFCVRRLVEALESYEDVKIVLTSEWRKWFLLPDYCQSYLKSLQRYLRKYGLEVYDKTEDIPYASREHEIRLYIKKNKIKNFIILDDEKSHYASDTEELYLVDSKVGFSKEDVEKLKKKCYELYDDSLYEKEGAKNCVADFLPPFGNEMDWHYEPIIYDGIRVVLKPTERYQKTGLAMIQHLKGQRISDMPGVRSVNPEFDGFKVAGLCVRVKEDEYDQFLNAMNEELYRATMLRDVTEVLLFEKEGKHECNGKFGL